MNKLNHMICMVSAMFIANVVYMIDAVVSRADATVYCPNSRTSYVATIEGTNPNSNAYCSSVCKRYWAMYESVFARTVGTRCGCTAYTSAAIQAREIFW